LLLTQLAVAVAALLIGLSKGGFGGMFGALITPMLALFMPADVVIGLVLPLLMIADVFAVRAHWQKWDRRSVIMLIPAAILGVVLGTAFITNVPTDVLRRGLGVIIALFVVYKLVEQRLLQGRKITAQSWHGLLAGGIAGLTSTLAHVGGPPITVYLLLRDLTPVVFVATNALFFAILNWIKVPFYIFANVFDVDLLLQFLWTLPLIPLGVWLGKKFAYRINKVLFERLVVIFLAISALSLIVGTIS
jgi:uncharacterized membrane protein YfcA